MTPAKNVALTFKLPPLPIFERLRLIKDAAKYNVLRLSDSPQQCAAIARVLASESDVILTDEPTGNLDENTATEIMDILQESTHKLNNCVVLVTHSNELAKVVIPSVCDIHQKKRTFLVPAFLIVIG